jgi:hypothetical protein
MDYGPWTHFLGQIIAAAGPSRVAARISWPMHRALKELRDEAARQGLLGKLPVILEFDPAPEAGTRARGADRGFLGLCEEGTLREVGERGDARLEVVPELLARYRRSLMRLDPETVGMLQRAGSRWAALASTVAKNEDAPARSPAATVMSLTACRQELRPVLR